MKLYDKIIDFLDSSRINHRFENLESIGFAFNVMAGLLVVLVCVTFVAYSFISWACSCPC